MCALPSDAWTGGALLVHTSSRYSEICPRSSAISISRDWVLTLGTALDPIIKTSETISKFVADLAPGRLTGVPEEFANQMEFSVLREANTGIVEEHIGKVAFAWICPLVTHTLKTFFNKWNFYERDIPKSHQLRRILFLLIRVHFDCSFAKIPSAEQALRCLLDQIFPQSVSRGAPVKIVSSPFGNTWLINSLAQGIVSNVIGGIIMTDAYVFSMSEGAPVYIVSPHRTLIGMVLVTMTWCQNEWVHYTFAANLASCLLTILQQTHCPAPCNKLAIRHDSLSVLDRSVVIITCGSSKGTGILVDKDTGTFLTCSHVIDKAPEMEISVVTFRDIRDNPYSRVPAKLLFSNPKMLPYDVAVLKVKPSELDPSLEAVQFSDAPIVQGEPVVAVGFGFILSTWPSMSGGVVSKSLDCMLMTTCCTHDGFSGGPIISRTTGKMLGINVSNVRSTDNRVYYQRMSMSVPVTVLSKPLRQYLLTDNVDALRPLTSYDPIVRKIWSLDSHRPSKL